MEEANKLETGKVRPTGVVRVAVKVAFQVLCLAIRAIVQTKSAGEANAARSFCGQGPRRLVSCAGDHSPGIFFLGQIVTGDVRDRIVPHWTERPETFAIRRTIDYAIAPRIASPGNPAR
jgi:hypothetical protein